MKKSAKSSRKKVPKKPKRKAIKVIAPDLGNLNQLFSKVLAGDMAAELEIDGQTELARIYKGINILLAASRGRMKEANRTRAELEAILKNLGEGLIVVDESSTIVLANEHALFALGFKQEEDLVGKRFDQVIRVHNAEGNMLNREDYPFAQTLRYGETVRHNHGEIHFSTATKEKFPVSIVSTPVFVEEKIKSAVSVFRDISHEMRIEEAKNDFISLASHQLRTPLSIITLYIELLRKSHNDLSKKEREGTIAELHRAVTRITRLVNALLNVSHIELGTLGVHCESVDFTKLVLQELKEIRAFKEKDVVITVSAPETPVSVYSDSQLVRIVVENLITNAIKYTKSGTKIMLSIKKDKRAGSVLFTVKDRGYGIPAYQQEKVFTKLFRADNIKKTGEEGTGLGLYITKSVLDKLGGKIWFKTLENKGTTFYVSLPSYPSAVCAVPSEETQESAGQ